jgi:hypothetical protein
VTRVIDVSVAGVDDDQERRTESGIILPVPDPDKGHPICTLQTDVEGLVFNLAAAEPADVERIAQAIATAQLDGDGELLAFTEPMYGQRCYLTPEGLRRVVGVTRGFAVKVDPRAQRRVVPVPAGVMRA